ncbi:hypothetical protein J6590_063725 [Homalodisca vitripennis]|nr:hypothetical protein J6590_063725 [Homalodisca vitripennis]
MCRAKSEQTRVCSRELPANLIKEVGRQAARLLVASQLPVARPMCVGDDGYVFRVATLFKQCRFVYILNESRQRMRPLSGFRLVAIKLIYVPEMRYKRVAITIRLNYQLHSLLSGSSTDSDLYAMNV